MHTLPNFASFTSCEWGFSSHQHLHKAWHSPGLSNPIPGRSDQQTSPSLSCRTTGQKHLRSVCLSARCLPKHLSNLTEQTPKVRCSVIQVTQTSRHKQASETSSHWSLHCQAQASIHNRRDSCNSQRDQVFPRETNNWSRAMTPDCRWCSTPAPHVPLPV